MRNTSQPLRCGRRESVWCGRSRCTLASECSPALVILMKHTCLSACLLLSWATIDTGASQVTNTVRSLLDEVGHAEQKWKASKTDAYQFRVEPACNGLIPQTPPGVPRGMLFRVSQGKSTFVRSDKVVESLPPDLVQYSTVERLFTFIRTWASGGARVTLRFDQELGYPTAVCVDPATGIALAVDDEVGFVVKEFKLLPAIGDR